MTYNTFTEFCENIAIVKDVESFDKEATYEDTRLTQFLLSLKISIPRFNSLELSYIQNAFSNTGEVSQKITAVYPDGEIPDGIINTIAKCVYGKDYSDDTLTETQRKIINVLSVYYVISIN